MEGTGRVTDLNLETLAGTVGGKATGLADIEEQKNTDVRRRSLESPEDLFSVRS